MHRSRQWFIAQAVSSIQHGVGSRLAFELARRAKRWTAPRRGITDSPIQGFAVTVRPAPCLAIEDALGCRAQVLAGRVWITAEGSPVDTIADAGTGMSLEPGVRLNVSAFRDFATVLITAPRDRMDIDFSLHARDGMQVLTVKSGRALWELLADGPAVIAAFARRCLSMTASATT
jgi:hypothetical protein